MKVLHTITAFLLTALCPISILAQGNTDTANKFQNRWEKFDSEGIYLFIESDFPDTKEVKVSIYRTYVATDVEGKQDTYSVDYFRGDSWAGKPKATYQAV